jgi:hypothetical protein
MQTEEFETVLRFWFPGQPKGDHEAMARHFEWRFRGGADSAIAESTSAMIGRPSSRGSTTG